MDAFENSRLELFRANGFDGHTDWLTDESGRRTAAIVGGTGDRATLLLHGALSNANEWALLAPRLEGRLVIPDWPGSGLTPPVGIREIGLRTFAQQWLASVVEAIGADEVDIVGSSAGGYLGLLFALAHPERVRRLVQVGSLPGVRRAAPLVFRLLATPIVGRLLLSQQPKDAEANRKVFANLVAHPERIPVAMLEADLAAMALPNSAPSALDFCRALLNPITGMRPEVMVAGDLASPRVPPALWLWGAEDNFVRPESVRSIVEDAPNVTLEIVEDAGHLLTFEAPERIARSITAFLRS